jgi:hypothetical protein
LVEIVLCIASYFYVENYQIKTSDIRVIRYKEYCGKIMTWLQSNDVETSKANLIELRNRMINAIEAKERVRKNGVEKVENWIQVLLVPLLLAVFAEIIDGQTNISMLLSSTIVLIVTIGIVCATLLNCYNMVSFFQKRKLEQMRSFADDIQGIIDTQFEDGIIRKVQLETIIV